MRYRYLLLLPGLLWMPAGVARADSPNASGVRMKFSYGLGREAQGQGRAALGGAGSDDSAVQPRPASVLAGMRFSGREVLLPFASGHAQLDAPGLLALQGLLAAAPSAAQAHLHVIGYARAASMNLIALSRYGDAKELARARAVLAATQIAQELQLSVHSLSVAGDALESVASGDAVPAEKPTGASDPAAPGGDAGGANSASGAREESQIAVQLWYTN